MKKTAAFILSLILITSLFFGCSEDSANPTRGTANRIVVLLTDYGDSGPWMARLKGYVLTVAPSAEVIEGSSELPSFDVISSAFLIKHIYPAYPEGSVFVSVVEPEGGALDSARAIVVQYDDRFFTAPDNGLLTYMLSDTVNLDGVHLVETLGIGFPPPEQLWADELFATVGGLLTMGWTLYDFGAPYDSAAVFTIIEPTIQGVTIYAQSAFIDNFGNVTTNAGVEEWEALPIVLGEILNIVYPGGAFQALAGSYYDSVPAGDEVIFINSLNLIQIAVNLGSLAERYGISAGDSLGISRL